MPDIAPQPENEQQEPIRDLLVNMMLKQAHHKMEYDKIYRAKGLDPVPPHGWGNLNDPRLQLEIRQTFAYLTEELMEAINLLKNKPWRQTARETDPEAFYKELADAWHFWLELNLICGMTPELIAKYYFGEAAKNDERRASNY